MSSFKKASEDKVDWETTRHFTPRFDDNGLITAVVCDSKTRDVVMVAFMNAQALELTLQTGIAHYWSRSRQSLWKKGESSGSLQTVTEIRTDCDQDVVVLNVETAGSGSNCHTGRHSCFYRIITSDDGQYVLDFDKSDQPRFDPHEVYKR